MTCSSEREVVIPAVIYSSQYNVIVCKTVAETVYPLECSGNYSATSNMKLVHWPLMGGLLHLVQRGGDWAPSPLLAVPNVTAHLSTVSVPVIILLYNGPLLCGFNVLIKG